MKRNSITYVYIALCLLVCVYSLNVKEIKMNDSKKYNKRTATSSIEDSESNT